MNILVIGKFSQESFGLHIAETLADMGHNVFRFQPGRETLRGTSKFLCRVDQTIDILYGLLVRIPAMKKFESAALLETCTRDKIEFTIVTHDFLLPEEVAKIRRLTGGPIALWHPDHIANCGKFMFLNAPFDALFFKDPYMVSVFRKELRKPTFYLPECCNPVHHRPVELSESDRAYYSCDITTAGNLNPNREAFFRNLAAYDVKIWGSPPPLWMDTTEIRSMVMSRMVLNEEKAKAFRAAKIVVNNLYPAEVWGINCRAFEIPACEGFELVSWRPGIAQLFEDGREIVSFSDADDLKKKVEYYLPRETERLGIAKAGRERVHRDHTYRQRLDLMLDTIFGQAAGFPLPRIRMLTPTSMGTESIQLEVEDGSFG